MDTEVKKPVQYLFSPTTLNKEIPHNLIPQPLRMLSSTFYMDTLFVNQKYIIGNTCVQIFTDGEGFVHVYPMQYKSQDR